MNELDEVIKYTHHLLFDYHKASNVLDYIKSRISLESIFKYSFGYFPQLSEFSLFNNYSKHLQKLGLYFDSSNPEVKSKFLYFENYQMVLAYQDLYSTNIGIVGRTLLPDAIQKELSISKYKNTKFSKSSNLFNLNFEYNNIINNDYVIITEGQFDAIKASDCGIQCVVAAGTSSISQDQFLLLRRFTDNFYLCLDNDLAGKNGHDLFINKFKSYCNIACISLPTGYKDIDEFVSSNSPRLFEELRRSALFI